MKIKRVLAVMLMAVLCIGGSGTAADPYKIRTAEQMNTIGANSGDWTRCF